MSRRLRRFILFLSIVAMLFSGVNVFVARFAGKKIGEAIKKELRLSVAPDVRVGGFPVLLHVVFGDLPSVTFDARDLTIQGLRVARAHAELADLHASNILDSSKLSVHVRRAVVVATIVEASVNDYVGARDRGTTLALGSDAVSVRKAANIGGGSHVLRARGHVLLRANRLVFVPVSVTLDGRQPPSSLRSEAEREISFSVAIPSLPGGIHADALTVLHKALRLTGSLNDKTFRLGA